MAAFGGGTAFADTRAVMTPNRAHADVLGGRSGSFVRGVFDSNWGTGGTRASGRRTALFHGQSRGPLVLGEVQSLSRRPAMYEDDEDRLERRRSRRRQLAALLLNIAAVVTLFLACRAP